MREERHDQKVVYGLGALALLLGLYGFYSRLFKAVGKYALWGALVTMPAALITIAFDLGHEERIWRKG